MLFQKDNGTQKAVQRQRMGILLCEQNFRDVWSRNENVGAEIGQILHTDTRGKISSKDVQNIHRIYAVPMLTNKSTHAKTTWRTMLTISWQ